MKSKKNWNYGDCRFKKKYFKSSLLVPDKFQQQALPDIIRKPRIGEGSSLVLLQPGKFLCLRVFLGILKHSRCESAGIIHVADRLSFFMWPLNRQYPVRMPVISRNLFEKIVRLVNCSVANLSLFVKNHIFSNLQSSLQYLFQMQMQWWPTFTQKSMLASSQLRMYFTCKENSKKSEYALHFQ